MKIMVPHRWFFCRFTGLKCKYCHGQPGFGRYFPASVRSLAQTTTSQTIIKHIAQRCQYCPSYVRAAVVESERQQEEIAKNSEKAKKPHGGRKLFFERIWSRLHGGNLPESAGVDDERPAALGTGQAKSITDEGRNDAPKPIHSIQSKDDKSDEREKLDVASSGSGHEASSDGKKELEVSYPLKKRKHLFRSLPTQKRKHRSEGSASAN
jgi:hypothetical protein